MSKFSAVRLILTIVGRVLACALAIPLAGCSKKPPSENDIKMAVQYYLVGIGGYGGSGISDSRAIGDNACSSAFHSESGCEDRSEYSYWVGSVKEVLRVLQIGESKEEPESNEPFNSGYHNVTTWPVKVELRLECLCREEAGPVKGVHTRSLTTTHEYELRFRERTNPKDVEPEWYVSHY
jgi:hypothetical protein